MLSNSKKFDKLIGWTIDREGRTCDTVPGDTGGQTKFGISKQSYPNVDIPNLTEDQAKDIYFRDYWKPLNCDTHDDKMALAIFDSAVNCGVGTVRLWLPNCQTWGDVLWQRLRRYVNIVQKNPTQQKFFLGWVIRTVKLAEFKPPS